MNWIKRLINWLDKQYQDLLLKFGEDAYNSLSPESKIKALEYLDKLRHEEWEEQKRKSHDHKL